MPVPHAARTKGYTGVCRFGLMSCAGSRAVIVQVLNKLTPEEICDGLGLCGNGSSAIKCLGCKAAAEAAIQAAKSNSSIHEIESIIEKVRRRRHQHHFNGTRVLSFASVHAIPCSAALAGVHTAAVARGRVHRGLLQARLDARRHHHHRRRAVRSSLCRSPCVTLSHRRCARSVVSKVTIRVDGACPGTS